MKPVKSPNWRGHMSEVNDESLGMTSFDLRRRVAVERALARVRHHLGDDSITLSVEEVSLLGWLLAEMWSSMDFASWEQIALNEITLAKTDTLVELARKMVAGDLSVTIGATRAADIIGKI